MSKMRPDVVSAKGLEILSKHSVLYLVDNADCEGFLAMRDVRRSEFSHRIQRP